MFSMEKLRCCVVIALLYYPFYGCKIPDAPICVGDACGYVEPADVTEEAPTEPAAPTMDSGSPVFATIGVVEQRLIEIRVSYRSSDTIWVHVGAYSVQVPEGEGSIVAPVMYDDLCILDQDILVRLVSLDGEDLYRELHDTTARVRRPGMWRWEGASSAPGVPVIDCLRATTRATAYDARNVAVVWADTEESRSWSWVDVGWDRGDGLWTMHEDRIEATHPTGANFTVESDVIILLAVVTWDED